MHHNEQTIMLVIIISIQSHAMQATLYLRHTSQSLVSQKNTDRPKASVFEFMLSNYRYPLLYNTELVVQFHLEVSCLFPEFLALACYPLFKCSALIEQTNLCFCISFLSESAHIFWLKYYILSTLYVICGTLPCMF